MKHYRLFLLLIGLLVLAFLADIAIGSVSLSIRDVWNTFIGSNDNLIYREIILNHRLPKAPVSYTHLTLPTNSRV